MIDLLADRLMQVRFSSLSAAAQERLLLCLLANIAVAVAGTGNTRLPAPAAASEGHLLFDGRKAASGREAAFWNAAAMHARTQDDFHPLGNLHVGTVVTPAALATAETRNANGEALLDAIATGYAASVALSRSLSAHTTPRGLRSTCLYAPFGASAAVARLCGFDSPRLANALALTASMAGGTTQCWIDGSDEYQLHVARAAEAGLVAAALTEAGVRGGQHQLDGKAGFFNALAGFVPDATQIVDDADPDRAIVETVIKRFPVSGICQPVVLLAERLAPKLADRLDRIDAVRIFLTPFELNYPGTLNRGPFRSFSDVLMSAAFCCNSVLVNGRCVFDDLLRLAHPLRDRLIARTEVLADAALGTLSCRIEVDLSDGTMLVDEVHNGGEQLALGWDTIDDWARALWRDGGRDEARYAAFRSAIRALPQTSCAPLIATLVR
jgi:2-methylcitrate dehydratase PrpD